MLTKIFACLFITTAAFADFSSFERPSSGHSSQTYVLEDIDHKMSLIHNELAEINAIYRQSLSGEDYIISINENMVRLLTEMIKTNELLMQVIWHQSHSLDSQIPVKKQ